jgi:hypothetical protein
MTTSATSPTVAARPIASADPDLQQAFDTAPRREPHTTRSGHPKRRPHRRHNRQDTPPSLPSATQLAARGEAPVDPLATPQSALNPLQAPPASRHATDAEFASLLARYDDKNANAAGDAVNAELSARLEEVATAGYPDDARVFEQDVQRALGMLAQLPADVASAYREQMKSTWDMFESTPDAWLRDKYAQQAKTLRDQIDGEYQEARTDPDERAQAIFNAPFGNDLLGDDAQPALDKLSDLKREFHQAHTKADREAIFSAASKIKQSLQNQISDTMLSQIDAYRQAEAASETEVMQAFELAQGLSGRGATPGARLEYFVRQVCGNEAHARAFTELRGLTPERLQQLQQTDPDRFAQLTALKPERLQQLTQWENTLAAQDRDAARTLPEVPLEPPKYPSDVRFYLPAPGASYGEALRLRYADILKSIVAAEKRISVSHEQPSSPIRQNYIKTHQPVQ